MTIAGSTVRSTWVPNEQKQQISRITITFNMKQSSHSINAIDQAEQPFKAPV
jgi:hypothetical protein